MVTIAAYTLPTAGVLPDLLIWIVSLMAAGGIFKLYTHWISKKSPNTKAGVAGAIFSLITFLVITVVLRYLLAI